MGDIKFYSPVDFDDTSSGVTIEGELNAKGDVKITGAIYDSSNDPGTSGQILSSTVTGTDWVNQGDVVVGSAERTEILVKNLEGSALSKGDPIYIIGSVGASGRLEVGLADAGNSSKMPCAGLLSQDLAINGEGYATVTGKLKNLITSPIDGATPSVNDTIYVKSGGGLTLTKPTGVSNLIQNVGQIGRVSTSADGNIVVSAILRTNDIPNLTTGKIWVGDGNTTESTVVHLDETNGRMGIGTSAPGQKLHVVGDIKATNKIFVEDSSNSRLEFASSISNQARISAHKTNLGQTLPLLIQAEGIKFGTVGGGEKMRMDSSGNVGIGTTSPATKLHVAGLTRLENSGDKQLQFVGTSKNTFSIEHDTARLYFYNETTASYPLTILNGDNVGIGTTSPNAKLHIGPDSLVSGYTPTTTTLAVSDITNGAELILRGQSPRIWFDATAAGSGEIYMDGTNLNILSGNPTSVGSSRLYVNSSGNVGIGTTNPLYKLAVEGSVAVQNAQNLWIRGGRIGFENTALNNAAYIYNIGASGSSKLNIADSLYVVEAGNVGIGTTSPSANLEVASLDATGTKAIIRLTSKDLSVIDEQELSEIQFFNSDADGSHISAYIKNIAAETYGRKGQLALGTSQTNATNAVEAMRIDENGNVGIGTTSPNRLLDVDGVIGFSLSDVEQGYISPTATGTDLTLKQSGANAIRFDSRPNANSWINAGTGNVGIGTSSPSQKLHVVGKALITDDVQLTGSNPRIDFNSNGASSLRFYDTTNASERMRINSSGKVLIGVTSNQTQSKLTSRQDGSSIEFGHLNQSGQYYGTLGAMSSSGSPFIAFSADNSTSNTFTTRGAKGFVISQDTNISGDLIFSSVPLVNTANQGLVEKMRITSGGNVGIGTTTPGYKLEISRYRYHRKFIKT